jgi:thiosulfate dehydrogenase [quinone] large subunit
MSSVGQTSTEHHRTSTDVGRPALVALLAVQIIIGYEWLTSGITKVTSGDFVSGLAADLTEESRDSAHWYRSFLDGTIIPNARTFAVLIEVGEIVTGIVLILAAIIWLARWERLPGGGRIALLIVTMLSALGASFMALNFHLASGANHPWLIPANGFDETIDVDAVLIMLQMTIFVFCGYVLAKVLGQPRSAAASDVTDLVSGASKSPSV